jgi:hypothetical protein
LCGFHGSNVRDGWQGNGPRNATGSGRRDAFARQPNDRGRIDRMRNGRGRVRERQTRPELRTGDETADAIRGWMTNAHKRDANVRKDRVMHRDVRKRNNDRRATVAVACDPDRGPQTDADRVAFRGVLIAINDAGQQRAVDNVTVARRVRDGVMDPTKRQRRAAGVVDRDDNIRNGQRGRARVRRVTARGARNG